MIYWCIHAELFCEKCRASQEFEGRTLTKALQGARLEGWSVSPGNNTAHCPEHKKCKKN